MPNKNYDWNIKVWRKKLEENKIGWNADEKSINGT